MTDDERDALVDQLTTAVRDWLQLSPGASADAAAIALVVPGVIDWADQLPGIDRTETGAWASNTVLGVVMLAARLVRRRNSPAGIEGWTSEGTAYVRNHDPDVALLLHLSTPKPKVG